MKNYIIYKCKICNKHFILMADEVKHSEEESKFITCPFHGKHKNIVVVGRYEDLKECMDNHVYVRKNRAVHQIK